MFGETYFKVSKKLLKQIKSDLEAVISFEKRMQEVLKDKRIPEDVKNKLAVSIKLMQGAENNTNRMRREIVEIIKNKNLIVKD